MDSASTSTAPVTYPVFAAVALGITGSSVYHVIDLVGGMFEAAGAVFEGSPDAPGTLLALLGFLLVQAATVRALVEIDSGREVGPVGAYRLALGRIRPLLGGLGLGVLAWIALTATGFLTPVAVWLVVRWLLLAQVVELDGGSGRAGLRRSAQLVRHRWLRVASLVGVGAVLSLALGPFLGALLILVTDAPLALLNVVAGVVYALAMPFIALVTSYVYFDCRARKEVEPEQEEVTELPAEYELAT